MFKCIWSSFSSSALVCLPFAYFVSPVSEFRVVARLQSTNFRLFFPVEIVVPASSCGCLVAHVPLNGFLGSVVDVFGSLFHTGSLVAPLLCRSLVINGHVTRTLDKERCDLPVVICFDKGQCMLFELAPWGFRIAELFHSVDKWKRVRDVLYGLSWVFIWTSLQGCFCCCKGICRKNRGTRSYVLNQLIMEITRRWTRKQT